MRQNSKSDFYMKNGALLSVLILTVVLLAFGGCAFQSPEKVAEAAAEKAAAAEPATPAGIADAGEDAYDVADASADDPYYDVSDEDAAAGTDQSEYDKYVNGLSAGEDSKTASTSEKETPGVKDKYKTDPVPEGKPQPAEPQEQDVDKEKKLSCTFLINCNTILDNLDKFNKAKTDILPSGGVIYKKKTVTFYAGESVFDVLLRETQANKIHMEFVNTPMYNSAYIEGIANLYEFDCGELSGWMYNVNGWYPNYGCSRYEIKEGDTIEWRYTCDLGRDLGVDWM